MSEVEKQESQKTVVAFVSGLLIGGLLVWVFSSTPEEVQAPKGDEAKKEEVAKTDTTKIEMKSDAPTGTGALEVADQKAGTLVTLGKVSFPSDKGWVVVRSLRDNVGSGALGASRYNVTDGLIPTAVALLSPTVAGQTYQVTFFTDEGDKGFSLLQDKPMGDYAVTFKAN